MWEKEGNGPSVTNRILEARETEQNRDRELDVKKMYLEKVTNCQIFKKCK